MLIDLARRLGRTPAWCRDLCEYYHVSPSEALRLGTRVPGRRPCLPGSATCRAVSGKTWEELWGQHPRDTEEAIRSFWQEVGSWCAFRQAIRNRRRSFRFILTRLGMGDAFLEYGAGIAPASWWLLRHSPVPLRLTIADLPSEHLTFGAWRLARRLEGESALCCWSLRTVAVDSDAPLTDRYRAIACIETLEHLSRPVRTLRHLADHLDSGGWLFEDFTPHATPEAADLSEAQAERPGVYAFLSSHFRLVEGRHWAIPGGGGTRVWRKQ